MWNFIYYQSKIYDRSSIKKREEKRNKKNDKELTFGGLLKYVVVNLPLKSTKITLHFIICSLNFRSKEKTNNKNVYFVSRLVMFKILILLRWKGGNKCIDLCIHFHLICMQILRRSKSNRPSFFFPIRIKDFRFDKILILLRLSQTYQWYILIQYSVYFGVYCYIQKWYYQLMRCSIY